MHYIMNFALLLTVAISCSAQVTVPEVAGCASGTYRCYQNGTWIVQVCDGQGWKDNAYCAPGQTCTIEGGGGCV
jgi:hypothetical protein